jgi:hypothetical protein
MVCRGNFEPNDSGIVRAFAGPLIPNSYFWTPRNQDKKVPRIPDMILDGIPFLFRSKDEAIKRAKVGGTGFVVCKSICGSADVAGQNLSVGYLISNRHVVFGGGASVVSMNRLEHAPDVFDFEPTDWVEHPSGDDVAGICIHGYYNSNTHKSSACPYEMLLTVEEANQLQIGIGDEVFMAGRFINHQGSETNKPAARFGSISMGVEKIWVDADRRHQESFAVEMRSRTGFSGSPVIVYRSPTTVLVNNMGPEIMNFAKLLGINWGYIHDEDGENTWLNGVVPSWKIRELFEMTKLKDIHAKKEEEFHARFKKDRKDATQAFAGPPVVPTNDDNPAHKEDFTALLDEATQKQKRGA